jgi:hypothetical protein
MEEKTYNPIIIITSATTTKMQKSNSCQFFQAILIFKTSLGKPKEDKKSILVFSFFF